MDQSHTRILHSLSFKVELSSQEALKRLKEQTASIIDSAEKTSTIKDQKKLNFKMTTLKIL